MTQRIYLQCSGFLAEYELRDGNYLQVIEQVEFDTLFGSLTPQEGFRLKFAIYDLMASDSLRPAAHSLMMGLAQRVRGFIRHLMELLTGKPEEA